MSGEPTILHADLDAFFASVEQRDDPALRGRPVIVGPGVVLAASYEARAFGVRSAMGARKARQLCPEAVVVPARFSAYLEASAAVFEIFERTAPRVERMSIDEAFMDVGGLDHISGTPPEVAAGLRREVREGVGLPISVGLATTRALAKVASGEAKPDGLCVVAAGDELAFLHPLRVERLWGVGPATAARLHAWGVRTVGQAAWLDEATLIDALGPAAGRHVHCLAHNLDPRPARTHRRRRGRRSFGAQSALGRTPRTPAAIDAVLVRLVDRVARRMRSAGRAGRTVVLRLRFGDFSRATRSHTLPRATAATQLILAAARALLADSRPLVTARGLTLVGVTVTNLEDEGDQLMLAFDGADARALDAVLDEVRKRFGPGAVTRAALLSPGSGPRR